MRLPAISSSIPGPVMLVLMPKMFDQAFNNASFAQMMRYPGRPSMLTCGNNTDLPEPALQEYLPPLQTAPYNLLRRTDPAAAACWEETLVVDEALERLLALDALIVFEVRPTLGV